MSVSTERVLWAYWVPLLVWICLSQLFSSDAFSYSESSRFIVPILTAVFSGWSVEQIEVVHGVFRKIGHVFEFFVMGVLTYRTVRLSQDAMSAIVISGMCVLCAAALDEVHQMWTLYRGPSPVDVGYDFLGTTLGIWLFSVVDRKRALSKYPASS